MSDKLQVNVRLEPELAERMHKCMAHDLIFNQSAFIRDAIIEACVLVEADMNKATDPEPEPYYYPNTPEGQVRFEADLDSWRKRTGWYDQDFTTNR